MQLQSVGEINRFLMPTMRGVVVISSARCFKRNDVKLGVAVFVISVLCLCRCVFTAYAPVVGHQAWLDSV